MSCPVNAYKKEFYNIIFRKLRANHKKETAKAYLSNNNKISKFSFSYT